MNSSLHSSGTREAAAEHPALTPLVDVVEDASGITLYADLPGVPKERLQLHVEADVLTIEGEVKLDLPEGIAFTHAEVELLRFRRAFTLSRELDAEQVSAELKNGVLTLRIPKKSHAQPRRIEIAVA